jgi:pimeloyl-ACP methyl ester carboxylesterase
VLLLPTFGWDDMTSYRARREWARELAEAGYETVRIDLPGSEESIGSPLSRGRMQSWLDAVLETVNWLRASSGCSRLATIGVGLGGILAVQALSAGAPIDDLVLWAVPAKGQTYLREVRMYADVIAASMQESQLGREGLRELSGYVMSDETAEALTATRLTGLTIQPREAGRVLMLGRDARGVDERLREFLAGSGLDVRVAPASDFEQLMAHPETSRVPTDSIATTTAWLGEKAAVRDLPSPATAVGSCSDTITFEYGGRMIKERIIECETSGGRLVGIVSEPVSGERASLCTVAVNAGALRRSGPNRLQTEIARRCAARGVPAARFDLVGLGDSDGAYVGRLDRTEVDETQTLAMVREIHDRLQADGLADRFVPIGLCAGAYWGLQMALADPRAIGAILINLARLRWEPATWVPHVSEGTSDPHASGLRGWVATRLHGLPGPEKSRIGSAIWSCVHSLRALVGGDYRSDIRALRNVLRVSSDRGLRLVFLFSHGERVHRRMREAGVLAKLGRWPTVTVEQLPTNDHEVRPLRVQEVLHAHIDQALDALMTGSADEH